LTNGWEGEVLNMADTVPADLKYTKDHEWARRDGSAVVIGITDYAQRQLGDVVYVELSSVGDRFEATEPFGTVESVKAVTEVYMPVGGEIVAVNENLSDSPENINTDSYGEGWIIQVRMADATQLNNLLTPAEYTEYLQNADD
jgi:glycine cleavage system H protein